jgi:hypothetical protein
MTWPVRARLLALAIAVGLVVSVGTVAARLPCRRRPSLGMGVTVLRERWRIRKQRAIRT